MKKILLILLLISIPTFAFAQRAVDIPKDKVLTDAERVTVQDELGRKIFVGMLPYKNDYVDRYDRGTVKFNFEKGHRFDGEEAYKVQNYSLHKVIIPDGTTIKGMNFSQKVAHTNSITGDNLTFIDCNLTNVELNPTWTLINSNFTQNRRSIIIKEGINYEVYEVEKDGVFVEVDRTILGVEQP